MYLYIQLYTITHIYIYIYRYYSSPKKDRRVKPLAKIVMIDDYGLLCLWRMTI